MLLNMFFIALFGVGLILFAILVRLIEVETESTAASKTLPWAARENGLFWKSQVVFKFMKSYRKYLQEAYDLVSTVGTLTTLAVSHSLDISTLRRDKAA